MWVFVCACVCMGVYVSLGTPPRHTPPQIVHHDAFLKSPTLNILHLKIHCVLSHWTEGRREHLCESHFTGFLHLVKCTFTLSEVSEADSPAPSSVHWGPIYPVDTLPPLGLRSHWGGCKETPTQTELTGLPSQLWRVTAFGLVADPELPELQSGLQLTGLRPGICIHSFIHSLDHLLTELPLCG